MPRRLAARLPRHRLLGRRLAFACLSLSCVALVTAAPAQTTAPPPVKAKHKPDPYGSPLDTIMSSHLWTDVPQARDFVRETRPAPKDLTYTPLAGAADPERPKPRDAANVQALQAELEQDIARNTGRAKGMMPAAHEAKPRRAKKAAAAQ